MSRTLWHRTSVKILTVGLLIVLFSVGLLTVRVLNPTYTYQGRTLSMQEFAALVEQNTPLACAQVPSPVFDQIGLTVAYACFDTQAEVDAYSRDVWQAQ
jgi:hypothetical protein